MNLSKFKWVKVDLDGLKSVVVGWIFLCDKLNLIKIVKVGWSRLK